MVGSPLVERVLVEAKKCEKHLQKTGISVTVALLVPTGDPLSERFSDRYNIVEGPEHDVLTRYVSAAAAFDPAYIVRLTADCPMIPAPLISKTIGIGVSKKLDYISNVDPRFRTEPDGWDSELFSRKMLDYANREAESDYDREHVSTIMRDKTPSWARMGALVGYADLSHIKISVDTEEDFQNVAEQIRRVVKKMELAREHGHEVFRV